MADTLVGLGLILGLFSRLSGLVGVLMATNLTLMMAFSDFALIFSYYALSLDEFEQRDKKRNIGSSHTVTGERPCSSW
ncbi:MAG: hypothetical protein ABSA81_06210 [Candidatus Bathyarchaeia archaeon]